MPEQLRCEMARKRLRPLSAVAPLPGDLQVGASAALQRQSAMPRGLEGDTGIEPGVRAPEARPQVGGAPIFSEPQGDDGAADGREP